MSINYAVSVIIPTYNSEKTVQRCINSVIKQSIKNIEIIVIDDSSTDRTTIICEQNKTKDKRIKVINSSINAGAGKCRNMGIETATGEYLFFLDSDDVIPGIDVLKYLYLAAKESDYDIIGGKLYRGRINSQIACVNSQSKFELINYLDAPFDGGFYRFLYSRSFIKLNKIRFPELRNFEDPVFLIRSMLTAKKFYLTNDYSYCYTRLVKKDLTTKELIDRIHALDIILSFAYKVTDINYLMGKNLLDIINHSGKFREVLRECPLQIFKVIFKIRTFRKPKWKVSINKIKLVIRAIKNGV